MSFENLGGYSKRVYIVGQKYSNFNIYFSQILV